LVEDLVLDRIIEGMSEYVSRCWACCAVIGIRRQREGTINRQRITLAGTGFEKYTKTTRRAQFLAEMDIACVLFRAVTVSCSDLP